MTRIETFKTISGVNWITGQYLLPYLERCGRDNQGGVVLDLGCGESPFSYCFRDAETYIRMDRQPTNSDVIVGDLLDIPLPDASIEMVLLFQALTDTPCLEDCLREINRVLKPYGRLIVFETLCFPEHDLPHDYFRVLPEGLRFIGEKTGFQISETIRLGGLFTRFAMLWNTFLMGKLLQYKIFKPIACIGIVIGNLLFYALDRIFPHPRLASDYICMLVKIK